MIHTTQLVKLPEQPTENHLAHHIIKTQTNNSLQKKDKDDKEWQMLETTDGKKRENERKQEKRETRRTSFLDQYMNPLHHFKRYPKTISRTLGPNLDILIAMDSVLKGSTSIYQKDPDYSRKI